MKKVALFTCLSVFAVSISSCSKDDDKSTTSVGGTVAFKYDGTAKKFTTAVVNQEKETGYPDYLTVTAGNGTATDLVTFDVNEGEVGADITQGFDFLLAGDAFSAGYSASGVSLHTSITDNTGTHLKGTFSGTIYLNSTDAPHTITEGTFDINYKAN